MRLISGVGLGLTVAAFATMALAGGHGGAPPQVKARQGHMQLVAFNLGILGNMAKGETPYDAAAAQTAANNLVAVTSLDQSAYWAPGTDSGSIEGTRALPAIWENVSDVQRISQELVAAAGELASVAGDGQEAVGGALRAVGATCSECHKAYRVSNN